MNAIVNLTLDQQRARYAWDKSLAANGLGLIEEYTNLAKSVASLIMASGLMQTLAFLQAKSKDRQHELLLGDLCNWLGITLGGVRVCADVAFPRENEADFRSVMNALHSADSEFYMRASAETMALLRWLRQYADAVKNGG